MRVSVWTDFIMARDLSTWLLGADDALVPMWNGGVWLI